MSFYDKITNLFEKFIGDTKDSHYHILNELFNIEADIIKLYGIKKKNKRVREDIDIIFAKHLFENTICELYKSQYQELKRNICDVYNSQNMYRSKYYDELIKRDIYIIDD